MVNLRLDETVILITGGGTGLGLSIAHGLYSCGAKIACISMEYEVKYPENCLAFEGDIFDDKCVDSYLNTIIEKFGKIDILINNIGFGMNEICEKLEPEDFSKMFKLNLYSQNMMINKIKKYKSSGLKKVINISSTFSKAAIPTLTGYVSTKRGVLKLTKQLALTDESISYACVCPGYFQHKKHVEYFSRDAGKRFLATRIPLVRLGIPYKELVPAIITLCLPMTRNVKYTELFIDGGLSSYDGKE